MKVIEILLVEDNPGDVHLTREGLAEAKMRNNLHVVEDGEEAIEFLKKLGRYPEAPTPDIVLLDLNLPKKSGLEVLQEVKADPKLATIPVVILSSSEAEQDIVKSYRLHANCYINKPVDFERFIEVVKAIEGFWFQVVKLPEGS